MPLGRLAFDLFLAVCFCGAWVFLGYVISIVRRHNEDLWRLAIRAEIPIGGTFWFDEKGVIGWSGIHYGIRPKKKKE